ncbi:MAG: 2-dehydropantoate 2-reductase [Planctomycetes bacterium]|nr:2-dehydropantoate 2-reductase [Planctomycetota bacterium]
MQLKRVVVVGAGAVGGSIGGLLADTDVRVTLVARGEHGAALRRDGLSLRMPDRAVWIAPPCVGRVDEVSWRSGDVALVATKLQDAVPALDALLDAAGPGLPVVCAFNGIHGEQWAKERFDTVLSMLVWMPATHLDPGEVRLHSKKCRGVLDIGPYGDDDAGSPAFALAERFCVRLREAGFDAVARADITRWKHAKWITNLGGAAQALVTDDWKSVAAAARLEGEAVLDAAGTDRVPTDELLERCSAVTADAVDGQRRSRGSTWQSHARGQPMESPWLEGAMADLAAVVGVPAPVNATLAAAAQGPRRLTAKEALGG